MDGDWKDGLIKSFKTALQFVLETGMYIYKVSLIINKISSWSFANQIKLDIRFPGSLGSACIVSDLVVYSMNH